MKLIIGGAFQGKLQYAEEKYGGNVYSCYENKDRLSLELGPEVKIIDGLETFVLACTEENMEAKDYLIAHREELEDKVIIACDISQGVVPMDATKRAWREMTGRALIYLSEEAESVERVFCGLATKLK